MKIDAAKYLVIALVFILTQGLPATAQTDSIQTFKRINRAIVYSGDTIPVVHLPGVNIYDVSKYSYLLNSWKYRRTIYNVKKAHPYAVVANMRLKDLDSTLTTMKSERDRKQYTKEAESEIMKEFENEVKKLTIRQGIILVKLIDRETGMTSYEVIQDIRGGFTAFFWQGVARIFGNNLKMQFDPEGEDRVIEDIVMAMQYGLL